MNTTDAFLPGTLIHTPAEIRRQDDLTAYNATILGHLTSNRLDLALAGIVSRRAGRIQRTDSEMRRRALNTEHPDDLAFAIVTAGFTLASLGIESITRAA
jgi:hypothetical protein